MRPFLLSLSLSLRHFHASVEVEASSSEVSRGDRCCEFVRNGNRFEANGSSSFFFHASTSICRSEDFPIVRLNIKKLNTVASIRFRNNSSFLSAAPVRLLFHDLSIFDSKRLRGTVKLSSSSFLSFRADRKPRVSRFERRIIIVRHSILGRV